MVVMVTAGIFQKRRTLAGISLKCLLMVDIPATAGTFFALFTHLYVVCLT